MPRLLEIFQVVSVISITFIIVSTIGMTLNTIPKLQGEGGTDNEHLAMIETVCITWFTVEYILRFVGAPQKCVFVKGLMNIIDVLSIIPYFISVVVGETSTGDGKGSFDNVRRIVQVSLPGMFEGRVAAIPYMGTGEQKEGTFSLKTWEGPIAAHMRLFFTRPFQPPLTFPPTEPSNVTIHI